MLMPHPFRRESGMGGQAAVDRQSLMDNGICKVLDERTPKMNLKILLVLSVFLPMIAVGQDTSMSETEHSTPSVIEYKCVLSTANNGQTLTVSGKARSTAHDLAFDIPGCNETVLLTFAGEKDNDVSGSELRQDHELKRFQKYTSSVYKSTGKNICMECAKYGDVEAELTGKLEIATMPPGTTKDKANFIHDGSGKIIGTFGWGHPGPFAAYRLVIQSVIHVSARKLHRP